VPKSAVRWLLVALAVATAVIAVVSLHSSELAIGIVALIVVASALWRSANGLRRPGGGGNWTAP
jgi:hypothetical protein